MSGPLNLQTVSAGDIVERLDALRDAIAAVQINGRPLGEAVRYEPAGRIDDPIEVIIVPPSFRYATNNLGPSSMLIAVFVIAVASDITTHNLIALERGVADAIDLMSDPFEATVQSSDVASWRRGNNDLPAYLITVEMSCS